MRSVLLDVDMYVRFRQSLPAPLGGRLLSRKQTFAIRASWLKCRYVPAPSLSLGDPSEDTITQPRL